MENRRFDHITADSPSFTLVASSTQNRVQDVRARVQVTTSVSTHQPLGVIHPGYSNSQTGSFTCVVRAIGTRHVHTAVIAFRAHKATYPATENFFYTILLH